MKSRSLLSPVVINHWARPRHILAAPARILIDAWTVPMRCACMGRMYGLHPRAPRPVRYGYCCWPVLSSCLAVKFAKAAANSGFHCQKRKCEKRARYLLFFSQSARGTICPKGSMLPACPTAFLECVQAELATVCFHHKPRVSLPRLPQNTQLVDGQLNVT